MTRQCVEVGDSIISTIISMIDCEFVDNIVRKRSKSFSNVTPELDADYRLKHPMIFLSNSDAIWKFIPKASN